MDYLNYLINLLEEKEENDEKEKEKEQEQEKENNIEKENIAKITKEMPPPPSLRLRLLKPLLLPFKYHIYRRASAKQIMEINFETKWALKYSHRLATHPDITINQKPCQSEYLHREGRNSKGLLLYFHGGGLIMGTPQAARPVTSNLVNKSEHFACFSAKYPLLNETNTLSQTIDHAINIYDELLKEWKPEQIVIGGDSAGAHLALSIALSLSTMTPESKSKGKKPAGLLLFSPWIDLSGENTIDDSLIMKEAVKYVGEMVCGKDLPPNLAKHELLMDLPPIYLQYGTNELVSPESRHFAHSVREKGGNIEVDEVNHVFHGFHYMGEYLPESNDALERAAEFLDKSVLNN